jgi:uncharacterized protein YjiS (DUF1127 family)
MTSITFDPGAEPETYAATGRPSPRQAILSPPLKVAAESWTVFRNRAALAMMSERELSDLGLLPCEVRSEFRR